MPVSSPVSPENWLTQEHESLQCLGQVSRKVTVLINWHLHSDKTQSLSAHLQEPLMAPDPFDGEVKSLLHWFLILAQGGYPVSSSGPDPPASLRPFPLLSAVTRVSP